MSKSKTRGGPRKSTGPKIATKTHKEQVMAVVAKYDRRGYTQEQIRERLKEEAALEVNQSTVSTYLKELRQGYATARLADREALVAEKVEQYREVRREAWQAYERSKDDSVKRTREKVPKREEDEQPKLKIHVGKGKNRNPDKGDAAESMRLLRVIVTREKRLPSNVFLQIVLQTLEAEAKLTGLTVPVSEKPPDAGSPQAAFDWESYFARLEKPEERRVTIETPALPLPEKAI